MGKRRNKFGICVAAALIISVTTSLLWNGKHEVAYAREVFLDTETMVQAKIQSGQPFRILEIVSDKANARIGYFMGGCEPDLFGQAALLETEGLITKDTTAASNFPIVDTGRVEMIPSWDENVDLKDAGYAESKVKIGEIEKLLIDHGYTDEEIIVFFESFFGTSTLNMWRADVSGNAVNSLPAEGEDGENPDVDSAGQPSVSGNVQPPEAGTEQPPASEGTQPPEAGTEQPPAPEGTQTPETETEQPPAPEGTQTPETETEQPPASEETQIPDTESSTQEVTTGSGEVLPSMSENNTDSAVQYLQKNEDTTVPDTTGGTGMSAADTQGNPDVSVAGPGQDAGTDIPATDVQGETQAPTTGATQGTDVPATDTTQGTGTDVPATDATQDTEAPADKPQDAVTVPGAPSEDMVSGNDAGMDLADDGILTLEADKLDPDEEVFLYSREKYENREWFKRYVLGMQSNYNDLRMEVMTRTTGEITAADISSADLIYISGVNAAAYGDVSADVAKALLACITGYDKPTPCLIDYEVYRQFAEKSMADVKDNNLYKLCLVLAAENPGGVFNGTADRGGIADSWAEPVDSEIWQPVLNATVLNNGGHFVRQNVYWYAYKDADYITAKTGSAATFVNSGLSIHFSQRAVEAGFMPIVEAIDAENYNNGINTPDRESMNTGDITSALAVQYILKYESAGLVLHKDVVKVLELQPCRDFKFASAEGKRELIDKWLPMFRDDHNAVQVTCMTTAEFVGHNENINEEYDLIYIGSNTGRFNTSTINVNVDGVTENRTYRRYNDANMNGLVYSHVGDYGNVQYWGLIQSDYSFVDKTMYRFPGNDLTTYKLAELKEFLNSGSPVIVADDFFTYGGGRSITPNGLPTAINGGKVAFTGVNGENVYGMLDTSTYLYQFVVYAVHGRDAAKGEDIVGSADWAINWNTRPCRNFFYESGADAANLLNYINQQKLYLNLTTRPAEYSYTTMGNYGYIDAVTYLQPAQDGNYYLNYEFSISSLGVAPATQTYDCRLYIDINNDGKFSKSQEEITSLVITEITTGKVVERAADGYHLYAGVPYRLSRALPSEYMGCIAWNLVVTAGNNPDIHASETGYTVVREKEGQKQELKILQVTSGYSTGTNPNGGLNSNNVNLQEELANGTTVWGELLKNVPDFDLNITTISTYGDNGLVAKFKNDNTYLSQFDMLIFGFSDGFADIRYEPLLDAITAYANSGHCILLAHDTTFVQTSQLEGHFDYSRPNYEGGKRIPIDRDGNTSLFIDMQAMNWWGDAENDARPRYLTQVVRNIGGMDVYGVTENGPARNGNEIYRGSAEWNTLVSSGKDMAFKPNTYQTVTVPNTQGASYIQLREWLRPNEQYNWGQTASCTVNTLYCFNIYNSDFFSGLHTGDYGGAAGNGYVGGECSTLVGKVNDGMITNYPYKIPDNFYAANTHGQYWALDLESDDDKDGESDIVVWYTLNDITTNDNGVIRDDFYSVSPYDASNCYYIYNKGNITYTGVGHTKVSSEQEVKLFINTMIASYVASIKNPSITIVEDGSSNASEINSISVPFLEDGRVLTSSAGGNLIKVYFKVYDNNIVKGTKTITGNFYLDGEELKLSIYDVAGNKLYDAASPDPANVLASGESYYVEVPASRLNGRYAVDLKVEVFTDWVRNGVRIQSDKMSDTVTIGKVELFDLD